MQLCGRLPGQDRLVTGVQEGRTKLLTVHQWPCECRVDTWKHDLPTAALFDSPPHGSLIHPKRQDLRTRQQSVLTACKVHQWVGRFPIPNGGGRDTGWAYRPRRDREGAGLDGPAPKKTPEKER